MRLRLVSKTWDAAVEETFRLRMQFDIAIDKTIKKQLDIIESPQDIKDFCKEMREPVVSLMIHKEVVKRQDFCDGFRANFKALQPELKDMFKMMIKEITGFKGWESKVLKYLGTPQYVTALDEMADLNRIAKLDFRDFETEVAYVVFDHA